jgi:signal transduction histidine kinase
MRTPLTTIGGYVEGALDGVFEQTDDLLVAVFEESARLQRQASDLATLSRAEEHALALHVTREDLSRLATAAERLRTTGHGGGSGIGLTIARGIARASGGDVTASSAGIGRGATFALELPLAKT